MSFECNFTLHQRWANIFASGKGRGRRGEGNVERLCWTLFDCSSLTMILRSKTNMAGAELLDLYLFIVLVCTLHVIDFNVVEIGGPPSLIYTI